MGSPRTFDVIAAWRWRTWPSRNATPKTFCLTQLQIAKTSRLVGAAFSWLQPFRYPCSGCVELRYARLRRVEFSAHCSRGSPAKSDKSELRKNAGHAVTLVRLADVALA